MTSQSEVGSFTEASTVSAGGSTNTGKKSLDGNCTHDSGSNALSESTKGYRSRMSKYFKSHWSKIASSRMASSAVDPTETGGTRTES